MYVDILLRTLIKHMRDRAAPPNGLLSAPNWIEENRVVHLGLPRQVGKTTALVTTYRNFPSIFIVASHVMKRNLAQEYGVQAIASAELKNWHPGLLIDVCEKKIELILLDEIFPYSEDYKNIVQFAVELYERGNLAENFLIISLGT